MKELLKVYVSSLRIDRLLQAFSQLFRAFLFVIFFDEYFVQTQRIFEFLEQQFTSAAAIFSIVDVGVRDVI